jgi:hypothetical protein
MLRSWHAWWFAAAAAAAAAAQAGVCISACSKLSYKLSYSESESAKNVNEFDFDDPVQGDKSVDCSHKKKRCLPKERVSVVKKGKCWKEYFDSLQVSAFWFSKVPSGSKW